jgi:hypothetical protein
MTSPDKHASLNNLFLEMKKDDSLKNRIIGYIQQLRFSDKKHIVIHFVFHNETKHDFNVFYISIGSNNNFIVYFDRPNLSFVCDNFSILVNRILKLYNYPFFPSLLPNNMEFNCDFQRNNRNLEFNFDYEKTLNSFSGETNRNQGFNSSFGLPFGIQRKDSDTSNLQPFSGFGGSSFPTPGFVSSNNVEPLFNGVTNQNSSSVLSQSNPFNSFQSSSNDILKTPVKNSTSEDGFGFARELELKNILKKRKSKSDSLKETSTENNTENTKRTRKTTK